MPWPGASGTISWHVVLTGVGTGAFALGVDAVLAAVLVAYLAGVARAIGRRAAGGTGWPWWRVACFVGGIAGIFAAVGSGLAVYEDVDPSALVAQHVLLMMGAPPLLVLGRLPGALRALAGRDAPGAARASGLRTAARRLSGVASWPLYYGSMAAYFLTPLCPASVRDSLLLELTEAGFVAVGCLFWAGLAGAGGARRSFAFRIGALLVGMPFETAIGIALILWPRPLLAGGDLGSTHAAGLVLWLASLVTSSVALGVVLVQWVLDDDRRGAAVDALVPQGASERDAAAAVLAAQRGAR